MTGNPARPPALERRGGSYVRFSIVSLVVSFLLPAPARAQFTLLEKGNKTVEVGGYFRSLTGLFDQGFRMPGQDRLSGFNAEVLRLKWVGRLGNRGVLEIHDRFQTQASSASTGFGGSTAGFGVSVVPGRSLDLSTDFIDQDRLRAWHDVDRLSLTLYTGVGDLTLGRQAITWGISSLFTAADLWAQFSPFELDTEEKPGIDAARFLTYPRPGLEVDVVVADRGSAEDLSAGVRASLTVPWADLYLAGGKLWNEAMVMGGISAPLGSWKVRAEGVVPYNLDDDDLERPRVTLGVDRLGGEFMLSGEYHYNGVGAGKVSGYGQVLGGPQFARGESYFLGRQYLGGVGTWTPGNDRLSLTLSAMLNLVDHSTVLTPVVTYDFGQETRFSLGGLISSGTPPELEPAPTLRSEYGIYGDLLFTRVSIYF